MVDHFSIHAGILKSGDVSVMGEGILDDVAHFSPCSADSSFSCDKSAHIMVIAIPITITRWIISELLIFNDRTINRAIITPFQYVAITNFGVYGRMDHCYRPLSDQSSYSVSR